MKLNSDNKNDDPVNKGNFETIIEGKRIELFYISNDNIKVAITNYGARIVGLWIPDKNGKISDINIGYGSINDYLNSNELYYGVIVGRYANRIAKGKFSLNNVEYQLTVNNGPNHLHGGPYGFSQQIWTLAEHKPDRIKLRYFSRDGEESFPGNLDVEVSISIGQNNALNFDFLAKTDKPTVINLVNHCYFNLAGEGKSIQDHFLMIPADFYTPVDSDLIPTGIFEPVLNSPFNFRQPKKIGFEIDSNHNQIKLGNGYDHNFVLKSEAQPNKYLAAEVYEETTGRNMQIWTTEPGLQLYTGNFMNLADIGKYGNNLNPRTAFCLEAQHFPDSPNHASFPSTVLNPGMVYKSNTSYIFSII
jgi:aldose 1-epimerase